MSTTSRMMSLVATLAVVALAVTGCPNNGGTPNDNNNGNGNDNSNGTVPDRPAVILGRVSDVEGDPVINASVTLSVGRSTSTDDNGFFSFSGFETGEVVVARFEAPGFGDTAKSLLTVPRDTANPICVFLAEAGETITLDADSGATQREGDSVVTLAAGTLVDADGQPVSGDVELTTTFIDPSSEAVMTFPGSFDDAMDTSNNMVSLESFGFAIYELSQDGAPVNLAPGQTATIEYVLPDNAQSQFMAGDSIPLWEFLDDTAMWVEAGAGEIAPATDGSGRLAWFAEVEHFSAWNCDAPVEEKHCVSGRVLLNGAPVGGAEVAGVGLSYNGVTTAMTAADGTFSLDVKRGSTVRLEVRVNGAATPVRTQEITVDDTTRPCPDGTDVGDIDIEFTACVSGRVTNTDGTPAADVRVYIVPGETVVTAADGTYCGAAAANTDIAVFAEGRPSTTVMTSGSGTCSDGCATADLALNLPQPGDQVGTLVAGAFRSFDDDGLSSEIASLSGSFFVFDAAAFDGSDDPSTTVQEFGACRVTVQTSDPTMPADDVFSSIGALDPGNPGTASTGNAVVNLLRGDPTAVEPPLPFLGGVFQPVEDGEQLLGMGFGAGAAVDFAFPGGADLGMFSGAITVPPFFNLTQPNLGDPNYRLDTTSALDLEWDGAGAGEVLVFVSGSEIGLSGVSTSTTIQCEFPDNGSATVPLGAMALLPTGASATTSLTLTRSSANELDVPLNRTNTTAQVLLFGQTSVSRSFISFEVPNFCDLFECPAGFVCDPELGCVPK